MPDLKGDVISVHVEAKIGLPKYSNIMCSADASASVADATTPEDRAAVYADLWREARKELEQQIIEMIAEYRPLVS